jgi:hypothetical protein
MPKAPILNLGARWKASDVYWGSASANGQLLGVKRTALRGPYVNFGDQTAVYILYANFTPIYVGQANKSLYSRLKLHHLHDDLAGRWDRFSWFGFRRVVGGNNPKLSKPDVNFGVSTNQLLDHLEAMMIHAFEPALNGQEGRFGKTVTRYKQIRDDRLGPEDRELMESVASAGDFLPQEWKITKSGWKKK